jgi:putative SOS response-associated peptidase YedK
MCGRFAFFSPVEAVRAAFGVAPPAEFSPRYNIAPTQKVLTLVAGRDGHPSWRLQQWGLVPFWAREPAIGQRMINARSETLADKPSFRQAFRRRRCVVPASGFYEWRAEPRGPKTPFYISAADGKPLAMAGLWELWDRHADPDTPALQSFTVVTAPANDFMRPLHARMPALLDARQQALWLDPATDPVALRTRVLDALHPDLQAWSVSRAVNSPVTDEPGLITPVS